MKIVSINAGVPRKVFYEGRFIRTGIFKQPVATRVRVAAFALRQERPGWHAPGGEREKLAEQLAGLLPRKTRGGG
jgi:MOSC domain-containing protein YiiM